MSDEMMKIVRDAVNAQYGHLMPEGFFIYLVDEYSRKKFPAPNLWLEKGANPKVKYIAILTSDSQSVPALGETVTDAVNAAIAKIHAKDVRQ